jgi:penicillin-binding protein 2
LFFYRSLLAAEESDVLKKIIAVIGILVILVVGIFVVRPLLLHKGGGLLVSPTGTPSPVGLQVTHTPTAESAARAFLDGWQSENYTKMYSLLTQLTKDGMTQDQFRKTYQDISDTVTIQTLDYRIISVEMTPLDSTVMFEVTFHTILVGDITKQTRMLLKNQDGGWKVAWDQQTILPELQNGNQLIMHHDSPARGNIYDRNGLALAAEGDAVEIGVIPGQITDEGTMLSCLSRVVNKPRELIRTMYDFNHPDWYYPIGDVNKADIGEGCPFGTLSRLDGVSVRVAARRYYFGGGTASHVVGYIQQPSPENKAHYLSLGYAGDELVGVSGLEQWGEQYLAGKQGGNLYVVTSAGSLVSTIAESKPEAAMAIYTTLDRDLQSQIEQTVMGQFTGAVVVLNRNTGEVLAMMSSPGYDSNYFNPGSFIGSSTGEVQNILTDERHPLINRAAQGLYPLGSVFKIITMAAALQSGEFDASSIIYNDITGYFTELAGYTGTDWTLEHDMKPQGKVNLTQCLERSCNTCFWHVALDLYYKDAWLVPNMATAFGLGQKTGIIGVTDEAGLLPNPGWKHDTGGGDWTGGDALNQAIGQGSLEVTPLQVADFVAAVGNGGTLYTPQILYSIRPPIGDPVLTFTPETRGTLPVSQENLQSIQKAMTGVINDPKGTARYKFLGISDIYKIAGKTGTAQTTAYDLPNAWFVAYTNNNFPNKPDIAVVAIVERIGEGSTYAAPMVRRVLEIYFGGRPQAMYPWESTYGMRGTDTPVESETPTETPTETPAP